MQAMIQAYAICAFLGILSFALTWKLPLARRIAIAVSVALGTTILFVGFVLFIGDKPPADSRVVTPDEIANPH